MDDSGQLNSISILAEADTRFRGGEFGRAEAMCRSLLADDGDNPGALRLMSRILLASGRFHDALDVLRRIEIGPEDGWVHVALGNANELVGAAAQAIPHYQRALEAGQRSPLVKSFLARCLRRSGQAANAVGLLQEAIAEMPGSAEMHESLGDAYLTLGDQAGARDAYRQALDCTTPGGALREINGKLGNVLHDLGEHAASLPHLAASMPWAGGANPSAPGGKIRLAILTARGRCNNRTKHIIDVNRVRIEEIGIFPGLDYPPAFIDQHADVIFNAIADADLAPDALAQAETITSALSIPVLNPPIRIVRTTREIMAERLAGLPHAVVPATLRVHRTDLMDAAADATLAAMPFPLIARPAGSHAGVGTEKLDDRDALDRYLDTNSAAELYVTQFVDFQSKDGAYRKYRIIFIRGQSFPCHLSISAGWLNHYFRSEMARSDAFRIEEAEFLNDMPRYFGADVMAALHAVGQRIDLDYFGIDCAVTAEGQLLVFECNASMLVYMPYEDFYEYRREPIRRIRDSFTDMLQTATAAPKIG